MMLFRIMIRHTAWPTWLQHALVFAAYVWMCVAFRDHLIASGRQDVLGAVVLFAMVVGVVAFIIYASMVDAGFEPLRDLFNWIVKLRKRYTELANEIREEDAKREAQAGDISAVEADHD